MVLKIIIFAVALILLFGLLIVAVFGFWVTYITLQSLFYTFKEIYKNGKNKSKEKEKEADA